MRDSLADIARGARACSATSRSSTCARGYGAPSRRCGPPWPARSRPGRDAAAARPVHPAAAADRALDPHALRDARGLPRPLRRRLHAAAAGLPTAIVVVSDPRGRQGGLRAGARAGARGRGELHPQAAARRALAAAARRRRAPAPAKDDPARLPRRAHARLRADDDRADATTRSITGRSGAAFPVHGPMQAVTLQRHHPHRLRGRGRGRASPSSADLLAPLLEIGARPMLSFPSMQRDLGPLSPWGRFKRLSGAAGDILRAEIRRGPPRGHRRADRRARDDARRARRGRRAAQRGRDPRRAGDAARRRPRDDRDLAGVGAALDPARPRSSSRDCATRSRRPGATRRGSRSSSCSTRR